MTDNTTKDNIDEDEDKIGQMNKIEKKNWSGFMLATLGALVGILVTGVISTNILFIMNSDMDLLFPSKEYNYPYAPNLNRVYKRGKKKPQALEQKFLDQEIAYNHSNFFSLFIHLSNFIFIFIYIVFSSIICHSI